jgi:serine acetyltransferase
MIDSADCSRTLRSGGTRAHPRTGEYTRKVSSIDSLSGAKIGGYFFTKQATGVVINEMATVGK